MQVQPYLFFNGRADEALAFYKKTIGAQEQMLMRFKDNPDKSNAPPSVKPESVMHMAFKVGDTLCMGSDGMNSGKTDFKGFALSLDPRSEEEAKKMFGALSEGGKVEMPLGKTFFAKAFGMVTDKFGVTWMINVQ